MLAARRLKLQLLSILAAVLTACGGGDGAAAATVSPISTSAVDPGNAGGNKLLTVASWNLYLGAELGPVLRATSQTELLQASTTAWAMVVRNDFHVRAGAVAEQIAAARPELVGLQEAYTWRYGETPATMEVVYDYVESLLGELAARGLRYRVAARTTLTDLDAPVLRSLDPPALAFVRGTDHEIILAREDVKTADPEAHVFPAEHLLPVSVLGQPLEVKRGWASVAVKHQGVWLRFASTHLEAYHPYYRLLQAGDLAAALRDDPLPVVLVGDLNSDPLDGTAVDGVPNALAYLTLAGAGLVDAWSIVHPGEPGYTSPFPEDLTVEALSLDERIDHVLFHGALTPEAMSVLGTQAADRACGTSLAGEEVCLWPSDHAGLSATLRLEDPRFLALH